MPNPIFNALGGAQGDPGGMLQQLQQFMQTFKGNPKDEVMKLIQTGQISQSDLNNMQAIENTTNKMASSIGKATSKVKDFFKRVSSGSKTAGTSFGQLLRYSLGMQSLYSAMQKLISGMREGFQNLTKYDAATNKSISAVSSALAQLKNSLATAFAPIVNVVAPILAGFINLLSQAVTAIGMFVAALTGQKTFVKATAVQKDYASSLGTTAGAAGEAAKALKNLSGLDEINTFQSSSNSGGSGGGGGSSGNGGIQFETVGIDSAMNNWAEKFKEAWEKADFTEIGGIVGGKITDALDHIPWGTIQAKANKVATSLATFLNGAIETPGLWTGIGITAGQSVNTALGTIDTFINEFEWSSLGSGITSGLQRAFQETDFSLATSFLSNLGIAALDTAKGAVAGVNWEEVPNDIVEAIGEAANGVKTEEISRAFGGFFGTVSGALNGLTKGIWKQASGWFSGEPDPGIVASAGKTGLKIATSAAEGYLSALGDTSSLAGAVKAAQNDFFGIGQTGIFIYDQLRSLREQYKNHQDKLLGTTDSSYAKMQEIIAGNWHTMNQTTGDAIAQIANNITSNYSGIKNSTMSTWDAVTLNTTGAWFGLNHEIYNQAKQIEKNIKDYGNNIETTTNETWNTTEKTTNRSWLSIVKTVSDSVKAAAKDVDKQLPSMAKTTSKTFSEMEGNAAKSMGGLNTKISGGTRTLRSNVSADLEKVKSSFKGTWSATGTTTTNEWKKMNTDVTNSAMSMKTTITSNFSIAEKSMKDTATRMSYLIKDTFSDMKESVGATFDRMCSSVIGAFSSLKNNIKNPINGIIGHLNNMNSRIAQGMNNLATSMSRFRIAIPGSSPLTVSVSRIGSVARIPYLATGAVIPPNSPFLAVMGDQKRGQNIEAPADLIRQIVREEAGGVGNVTFTAQLNRRTIFEQTIEEAKLRQLRTGKNPFALA